MYFNPSQNSPSIAAMKDFKRFVVVRVSGAKEGPTGSRLEVSPDGAQKDRDSQASGAGEPESSRCVKRPSTSTSDTNNEAIAMSKRSKAEPLQPSPKQEVSSSTGDAAATALSALPQSKESPKYPQLIEPHTFAPKDLLALLKNIENEINACESALHDEIEKQNKYRVSKKLVKLMLRSCA